MKNIITAVNPKILKWARERSGLALEDLALIMKRDPDELRMWEAGKSFPPYTALEDMAYRHFKVPLAIFFFPAPPEIDDPVGNFRRLPEYELERFSPDTIQKIRLAQAYQDSLEDVFSDSMSKRMIHQDLKPGEHSLEVLAEKARKYIGITMSEQFNFRSNDHAFKAWRHALENAGVFTFKDSFKDRFLSGFCLVNKQYPIIMLNNSNSFTRQIFTLIHELGHILYGVNGITDTDEYYLQLLRNNEHRIENECNRFAAEVLVPIKQFQSEISFFKEEGLDAIPELASKYSVSREVILRRLLDFKLIDNIFYSEQSEEWNKDYLRPKKTDSHGNWYLTKIAYLGEGYVQSVFQNYQKGKFDKAALANHLNVKAKNLKKFESYLWR
jgi:Zn-dependent peptidase ImmA (M78 family)/transcriptional regulator with XRE-family HTH domain